MIFRLITRRSWASSLSAAGGGSSEDEKGENKERRGEPHPRRLYFRQGNEKSHPRNPKKQTPEAYLLYRRYAFGSSSVTIGNLKFVAVCKMMDILLKYFPKRCIMYLRAD